MDTNPRGQIFISYRRPQGAAIKLLVDRLHEVGIPTWRDVDDLQAAQLEPALKRQLTSSSTAGAVVWITPDVAASAVIRKIEVPEIKRRARDPDLFYVIGVAAGGLDYEAAAEVVDGGAIASTFKSWNLFKQRSDESATVRSVAKIVLANRIRSISELDSHPAELRVTIGTRARPSSNQSDLTIDWTHLFANGIPDQDAWDRSVVAALIEIRESIEKYFPDATIEFSGNLHLSAALALGRAFPAPRGTLSRWRQLLTDGTTEPWGIDIREAIPEFVASELDTDPEGEDLAVLVSLSNDVESAFGNTVKSLPRFRGVIHLHPQVMLYPVVLDAQSVLGLARQIVSVIKAKSREFASRGHVHLFIAGPAGLAFLVGQLANTVGPIQTYEYVGSHATGHYQPSGLLPTTF